MNYSEFKEYIENSFKELMGESAHVQIKHIIKNNDCEMDALIIMEGDSRVSPSIYLRDYYRQYRSGINAGEIVAHIYELYRDYQIKGNISADYFKDFSSIRDNIAYKLVSMENNRKLLRDVPHFEYLDLVLVFYFIINTEYIKNATALIHNSHLELWGVTAEELFDIAKKNTPRLLQYDIADMRDVIRELTAEGMTDGKELSMELSDGTELLCGDGIDMASGMYVLTNRLKMNGAVCMLYDDVLRDFSRHIGGDVLIIPSSVHEVILVPDNQIDADELNRMVKKVNSEEIDSCDILSNHIYRYVAEKNEIVIS